MTQEYPQHLNPFAEDEVVEVLGSRRRNRPSLRDAWFSPPPAPDVELRRGPTRHSLPPPQQLTSPPQRRPRRFSLSKTLEAGGGRLYATLSPAILRRFVKSSKKEPPTRPPPPSAQPPPPSPGALVRSRSQAFSAADVDGGVRGSNWTLAGDGCTRHSFRPKKRKAPPPPTVGDAEAASRRAAAENDVVRTEDLRRKQAGEEEVRQSSEEGWEEGAQKSSEAERDVGGEKIPGPEATVADGEKGDKIQGPEETVAQGGEKGTDGAQESSEGDRDVRDEKVQGPEKGCEGGEKGTEGAHESSAADKDVGEGKIQGPEATVADGAQGDKIRGPEETVGGEKPEEGCELERFRKASLQPLRILEDDEPRPALRRLYIDDDALPTSQRTRSPLPTPRRGHLHDRHLVQPPVS